MQLALRIEVDTHRGTREGVPRLQEMLRRHGAQATFFVALGADRSGRRLFGKSPRVSLLEHYGVKTLLNGTLLPAPDIAHHCADILRRLRDEGFEVGCHEGLDWRDQVAVRDAAWTRSQMQAAVARFTEVFGEAPKAHAAPGWQMNRDAFRLTQRLGFDYTSDTRGSHPFIPTWDAEIISCPQLPTTLPTLDELVGRDGHTLDNVAQHLLVLSMNPPATGHVFTLRAELEGGKWSPVFEQLLVGWKAQGYELVSLRQYWQQVKTSLPRHEVKAAALAGRTGTVMTQA